MCVNSTYWQVDEVAASSSSPAPGPGNGAGNGNGPGGGYPPAPTPTPYPAPAPAPAPAAVWGDGGVDDWLECVDIETGQPYFHSPSRGTTIWERPDAALAAAAAAAAAALPPPGAPVVWEPAWIAQV
jgi:hypothetical protein